jgi:glycosyltransferase involved in cell wall biosynthesis
VHEPGHGPTVHGDEANPKDHRSKIPPARSLAVQAPGNELSGSKANPTVAFDTWVLGAQARNQGVHVYGTQLLKYFRELAPQYSLQFKPFVRAGADSDANGSGPAPGFQPRPTGLLRHGRLWRFGGAWALASLEGVDLVFSPHSNTLYAARPVPTVTTIHDVIPVVLPWESRIARTLRFFLWSAARNSRAIITVSQHSKADLMRVYGLPESRIHVVYNGCDHSVFNCTVPDPGVLKTTKEKLGLDRPYVLHYGAIKPNKNLKRLVLACRRVWQRNPNLDFDLVLVGAPDFAYEEVMRTVQQNEGGRGRVVLTGALSQQDLVTVIKGATLAVFPSLYEGFCIPMIESMACGVPTITANSSCLPEISGGVLRYFDPTSEEEMSLCMEAVLESADLRRELSEKGRGRAAQFEWRRCAEQTLAILAQAAGAGEN